MGSSPIRYVFSVLKTYKLLNKLQFVNFKMQFFVDQNENTNCYDVFIHPSKLSPLKIVNGSFVRIRSKARRDIVVRVSTNLSNCSASFVQMSRDIRQNLCVCLGEIVLIEPYYEQIPTANKVLLVPVKETVSKLCDIDKVFNDPEISFTDLIVQEGMIIPINAVQRTIEFVVVSCEPANVVEVKDKKSFVVSKKRKPISRNNIPNFSLISYDDIGGLDDIIKDIRRNIELPLSQPQIFNYIGQTMHRGILIKGESGCGKTLLSQAINNETSLNFRYLSGIDLFPKSYDDIILILRKLTETVLSRTPSIIYFDDIDLFISEEKIQNQENKKIYYVILGIMDQMLSNPAVIFIGTSKLQSKIPTQLLSINRFSHVIEIPNPTKLQKIDIFNKLSKNITISSSTTASEIIDKMNLMNGSDIKLFIQQQMTIKTFNLISSYNDKPKKISVSNMSSIELTNDTFDETINKSISP